MRRLNLRFLAWVLAGGIVLGVPFTCCTDTSSPQREMFLREAAAL